MYRNIILSLVLSSFQVNGFGLFGLGNRYLKEKIFAGFGSSDLSSIKTHWIDQLVDHFNTSDTRTWKMRYFQNLQFWKPGGPIYLFIDGEGEAHPFFLYSGIVKELANETNGAMFHSEHRYYGKSQPFKTMETENLKYLSSRQALADVASLLEFIKLSPEYKNSKIIVAGGSYSANLAAWMKVLYPNLIHAAIASSAPVLAKKDFYEYLEKVSDDYEQHGTPDCYDKVVEIFNRYEQLFETDEGIEQIKDEESICEDSDMTIPINKQLFFLDKASAFMYRAQYGTPDSIKRHCRYITNTSRIMIDTDYIGRDFWNKNNECLDYEFDHMIEDMKNYDWAIPWTYQTCTEFGYYQSSSSDNHPFTKNIPVDLYYEMCTKAFGDEFDENRIDKGVKDTNDLYGGLKPNVTNVIFVNGDMDPWSTLGVLEDVSYDAPATLIPRSSHCRDLFSDRDGDPEELREARRYIKYIIKRWLGIEDFQRSDFKV